jgi:hypothetical protein
MLSDDLDRVLDEHYLAGLSELDVSELKARRAECQQVEAKVSYLRRLVQGRLDIVSAEMRRRHPGLPADDLSSLVEQLPQILADRVRAPGPGRMPTNLVPPDDDGLTAELDSVSGPAAVASLPDLDVDELQDVAERLSELEERVSRQRRALFGVLDSLQAEIAARYGDGEASG